MNNYRGSSRKQRYAYLVALLCVTHPVVCAECCDIVAPDFWPSNFEYNFTLKIDDLMLGSFDDFANEDLTGLDGNLNLDQKVTQMAVSDTDGDGVDDNKDLDDDNDGIPDSSEQYATEDTDGDGLRDYQDLDSDNDGIPDVVEAGSTDVDSNGIIDNFVDSEPLNGLSDAVDPDKGGTPLPLPDTDNDGLIDCRDLDSDDDGIPDVIEAGGEDANRDGVIDNFNDTTPKDGLNDSGPLLANDTDCDGLRNYCDIDSDDDTIPDAIEAGSDPYNPVDTDHDGIPDYLDLDSDNDTIPDAIEAGSDPYNPVDTDHDGIPDYLDLDSDDDNLNDTREAWWLCSRTDQDSNGDHINDSASVDPKNPDRTFPYRSEDINRDNDVDGDGLPDAAEKHEVGTDFKIFSTDGDPYGDGQEYFHVNMPEIPVADSPFVAAYPALSVRLSRIKVTPIGEITSTTGGSKQDAWSLTTETSDTSTHSFEFGMGQKVSAGISQGKFEGGIELTFQETWVWENSHSTTESKSESGFTQHDWSTAVTTRPNEAAKLALTLSVMNSGTAPAENIIPNVNIKLGEREIATITSPTSITSLDMGETSSKFVVDQGLVGVHGEDITVSLDQLKSIDIGTPLSIEAFKIDAKVKRWDDESGEWVCVGEDFDTYMREIDERCATLMFELEDGVYKEYKVYASSSTTLGDAFNWTINKDESIPLQNSTEWVMGFYPEDAYRYLNETLNQGQNLTDLELKPGWKIIMTLPKGDGPVIHWAMYGENMRSVKASVTDNNFRIASVVARVEISGSFVELDMTDDDSDTIYTVESPDIIDRNENACILATNVNNTSSELLIESMPAEVDPPLEDGLYIISSKYNNSMCLEGQTAGPLNVIQNLGRGDLNQRWRLENLGYGHYCIRNNNTTNYCPVGVDKSNCTGDNVTSVGVFLLEVDRCREGAGANVQLKEIRRESGPLEGYYVGEYLEYANETYRQFYFEPIGSEEGYYKIGVKHSGKHLAIDGNGNSIIQENYTGADHQKWIVQPLDSYPSMLLEDPEHLLLDSYLIVANHSKMALSESNGKIKQAVPISISAIGWTLEPVGDGYFKMKCVGGYLASDDSSIYLSPSSGEDNLKWHFVAAGDGYYQAISESSDECLTVEGGSMSEGSEVNAHDYRGYDNQRWTLISAEDLKEGKVGFAYLYQDSDYQSAVKVLDKDANDLGEFNNDISSLKISTGWAVILYDNKDYDGANKIYIGNADSLGNFNDKAESIKLVRIEDLGWFRIKSVWSINHEDGEIYLYGDGYESGGDPAEVDLSNDTGDETIWKFESPNNEWNYDSWYRIVNKYSMEHNEKDEYALYGDGDESPRTEEVDLTAEINSECSQWTLEFNGGYYRLKNKGPSDECYLEGEAGSGTGSYDEVEMEEGGSPDNEKVQWMLESTV